jgi:hypothetical protein
MSMSGLIARLWGNIRTRENASPKLFTCPKCRATYLGHGSLPDCPRCGYDYRGQERFRWDLLVYLLSILGLISFLLVSSSYRSILGEPSTDRVRLSGGEGAEKLPGSDRPATFRTPYHEPAR